MNKLQRTNRGFLYSEFKDCYGTDCVIQESSLAEQQAIWLGAKALKVQQFHPNTSEPWRPFQFPEGAIVTGNERMHLTREQVADLLPVLQRFADTGHLAEWPNPIDFFGIPARMNDYDRGTYDCLMELAEEACEKCLN